MRIFDENDNELREEDIDLEEGYLTPDRMFIKHHDAIEGHDRVFHYTVKAFYFEDGTSYEPQSEDDPHIVIDDAQAGLFSYNDIEGSDKKLRGIDLKEIEDSPAVPAQEAWDEYEDIQRYHLYTEEEKEAKEREKERKRREEEFMNTGLERIEGLEESRALKTEVEAVDDKVVAVDGKVDTLAADAATHDDIATVNNNIQDVASNVASLDNNIMGVSADLAETNSTVEDLVLTMADILGGGDVEE